jgi:hypothetical protein
MKWAVNVAQVADCLPSSANLLINYTIWMNFENIMLNEARHKKSCIAWFHLCEISRNYTFTITKNRLVVVRSWMLG